jgi:hypothetical protein
LERGYVKDRNALKAFKKVFGNVLHPSVRDDDEKLRALLREYLKEMDKYHVESKGWDGSRRTKTDIFGQTWITG